MLRDICNCEVSLDNHDALEAWNGVIHAVLSHGQAAPVHLGNLLNAAPGFAMGHAVKGLSALMLARRELVTAAADANRVAHSALKAGGATRRERLWCQALDAWLKDDPWKSVAYMEDALRLDPADTISMKLSHGIRFILGDNRGMLRSVEAVMPAHDQSHTLYGYALGCLSFALEENGHYAAAERAGIKALDYATDDAWGLHAVAHVYDMTHQPKRGIALISNNETAWDHCNNFRFHVWWHKALLHLDQREYDAVLDLYDHKIRSDKTDDFRDFSNASSLLMRLELEGISVGARWDELADLAETRLNDGCLTFADLHYMIALVGDNRTNAAARMIARVAKDGSGNGAVANVMKAPGIAASKGLSAFGEAKYDIAFANLSAAQPAFQSMGGSHAQRDIFERVTIEAGIRAGQLNAASALLERRMWQRAGAVDAFATSRLALIADARRAQAQIAAE